MPNNVKNRLTINGSEQQVKQVKDFLKGESFKDGTECLIDFNKIVPRPEVINAVGSIHMGIEDAVKNKYNVALSDNALIAVLEAKNRSENKLRHEDLPAFELACQAYEQTGYIYWYDWNCDNWGTKWNAYDFEESNKENVIIYYTAWSCVIELIRKLSEKFPDVEFLYDWADEDIGRNCGKSIIKNGIAYIYEPKAYSKAAYELAFELNPEYKKYYRLVNNNYKKIEEEEEEVEEDKN